jgi:hypothetical protein
VIFARSTRLPHSFLPLSRPSWSPSESPPSTVSILSLEQLYNPHLTHVSYICRLSNSLLDPHSTPLDSLRQTSCLLTRRHTFPTLSPQTTHLTTIPNTPARGDQRIPLMSIEVCNVCLCTGCSCAISRNGWSYHLSLRLLAVSAWSHS